MKTTMKNRVLTGLLLLTVNAFAQPQNCVFLTDIYPGPSGSNPALFTEFNGDMYFSCTGNAQGLELWRYNNGNPVLVHDINPGFGGSMLNNFTVAGPILYFS